jgi:diguanylate cyclase (GGDEF)-like protein
MAAAPGSARLTRFMSEAQECHAYRRMASIGSGMTAFFSFSSRAEPDRDLPLPVYRALVVSLFRGAARNAVNVLAYGLLAGFTMLNADDSGIRIACALLLAASLLRATAEIVCWRRIGDGGACLLASADEVESRERRYAAITGLFSLALALVQWFVLTRAAGEPFRVITVAGGLIFLVSAPARASGAPRAVALQTAVISLGFCAAMLARGGADAWFAILMNMVLVRHLRDSTRALHETTVSMLLAQRASQDVADKFDAALNNMAGGLLMIDKDERVQVSNQCVAQMFGLPAAPVGLAVERLIVDSISPLLIGDKAPQALADFFAGAGGAEGQWRLANGRILAFSRQPMPQGGSVITMTDITSEHEAGQNIQRMARFDPVTGLPNRAFFCEMLDKTIAAATGGDGFSLLSVDLDRFKEVNDLHGHHVGDLLLGEAAARMREVIGPRGFVARFGGDEFVILLEAAERARVARIGAALVRAVSAPYEIEGKSVRIGASVGAAIFPGDAQDHDAASLLKAADMALYDAKASGRGAVKFFVEDMALAVRRRRKLGADLRDALARGQLSLAYQPIIDIAGGRMLAVEALLRWTHPQLGAVPPSEFIPIAEETGAIVEIGAFVLERACREALAWPAQLRIAVNLSAVQFERGDLEATVSESLARTGLAPERLELEITESILIGNHEAVLAKLNGLHALGVHIALDDFGTGYSSLSYLNDFTFDKVKVDQSFVRDMAGKRNSKAVSIIRAVNAIGADLNMSVVAEGVETAEQLATLRALGVAGAQGFYFSRPAPAPEIGLMLLKEISEQALPRRAPLPAPDPRRAAG